MSIWISAATGNTYCITFNMSFPAVSRASSSLATFSLALKAEIRSDSMTRSIVHAPKKYRPIGNGQVRLITVPSFAETSTCVLLNLNTLDCMSFVFNTRKS